MFRVPLRRTALTAAVAATSALPATSAAAVTPDPAPPLTSSEQRELVPAYFYPDIGIGQGPGNPIPGEWQKMCDVAKRGSIIVANDNSGAGPPGEIADPNYRTAVRHCQDKGYKVVSYVATTNGTKARDTLEKQVRNQMLWYQPDGIFLDEMNYSKGQSAAGGTVRDYYTWISGIIRQGPANRDGSAKMVIGNPGNVSESQGDWALVRPAAGVPPVVDILVVFEGFAKDYKTWPQPKWVYPGTDRAHAYRIAHLVHDVREHPFSQERAITELSRKHHAGYVYVTTETTGTQATGNPYTDNVLWNMLAPSWFSRIGPTPPAG